MKFFQLSFLLILVFACSNSKQSKVELIDFVPNNTIAIIKTSNLEGLKSSINNSDFLNDISKSITYKNLKHKIKNLSHLKPSSPILICFSKDLEDSIQYSVITKYDKTLFIADSLSNISEENLIYKNKTITKTTIDRQTFYSTVIDSTFFSSSSKKIVDAVFESKNIPTDLKKIYGTISNDKTFSMILKPDNNVIKSFFIEDSLYVNHFTNYLAIDVELNQNGMTLNGITKANDSLKSLINIFKNTTPQINQVQNITPSNSDGFMSFTFNNFKIIKNNINKYNKKDTLDSLTPIFNDIIEVGIIYQGKKRSIVLNSIDVIATKDALLSERTIIDTYRGINIYNFSQPKLFSQTCYPLISFNNANQYCVLDDFFVFSDNKGMLQNIIANYQNKTTVNDKIYFKNIKDELSNASSLLQVANASTLNTILNKNLEDNLNYKLDHYNTSAIQFIYDNNFAHVNGILKKNKDKVSLNSVTEEFNLKLDQDLLNQPQFVKNHITNQKDIVVQDLNNNLYLISNTGKIIWKKQLQSPVLGNIEQIDIYKNGRLQLTFATKNSVYVIDRKGKDVGPFPLKFNDNITQPLAVFDYDKRKKYRLMVIQGKNVFMYGTEGKPIKGFSFKLTKNTILTQPKHFRIGSKDYIVLKTTNKLYILDRRGKIRVTPKTSYTYSNQPVFLHNNTFSTTSQKGDLISVDTKGNISSKALNLTNQHTIDATSKTLVTHNENKLSIKNKTTEMDFGEYSKPTIFYINNKIYVAITDVQSHKVYLYDSQSKLLPNFPVYGNSSIMLDNIDKDNNLEFATKGESNSIILYQIN
ncbi:ribonuclease HII [uncultured Algibacter sp.]|uniref:ribonuclease HII n=1 Tax=uncultured Algibacter sp. TaxID=298659 RepID=UPI003217AC37